MTIGNKIIMRVQSNFIANHKEILCDKIQRVKLVGSAVQSGHLAAISGNIISLLLPPTIEP